MTIHYRCQNCRTSNSSSKDVLRVAGWRIWSGQTMTGRDITVTICPACAGLTGRDPETGQPTGFGAVCDTCGDEAADDDFGGTEEDAEEWAAEHQCEPHVHVIHPTRATAGATT